MKQVVYSALIGSYERPLQQAAANSAHADFLLFTDRADIPDLDGWHVVPVAPRFPGDTVRSARYLKAVGHPILDDYDQSLWVDNRVVLKPGWEQLFAQLNDFDMALPRHSFRATLRDEFSAVISSGYDDPVRVRRMYDFACGAGVVSEQALWTGILLRRRTADVAECMRNWMDLILLTSRRDQLSIHTALAPTDLRVNVIEMDNIASSVHDWVDTGVLNRDRRIQMWRPEPLPTPIRFADMLRSTGNGRLIARGFERAGLQLPTLGKPRQFPSLKRGSGGHDEY